MKSKTAQIVTKAELGIIFGVSLPTIDNWVNTGCPYVEKGGRGSKWQFNSADVATWRVTRAREEATGGADSSEKELIRRKLAAQTQIVELELAMKKSEVAPVAQFERAAAMAFAEVKAALRNVPPRTVRMLIGETDESRFKKVLLEEIDQALSSLGTSDLVLAEDLDEGSDD